MVSSLQKMEDGPESWLCVRLLYRLDYGMRACVYGASEMQGVVFIQ